MVSPFRIGLLLLPTLCLHDIVAFTWNTEGNRVLPSCPMSETVCKINFKIGYNMTMISWGKNRGQALMRPVVHGKDGRLYQSDAYCQRTNISDEEVASTLLGDGTYKRIMVINGQLPGPPIVVFQGQHVAVTVTNTMDTEAVTIHWHGLHMKKSPWMDGAGSVSHCPILPGQVFQYRFEADVEGTHWYHSHLGEQRSMGLAGPLVVLPRSKAEENARRGEDVIPAIDDEFHMMITDWSKFSSEKITFDSMHIGMGFTNGYDSENCHFSGKLVDGSQNSWIPPQSILINGKGRYFNPETGKAEIPILPLEVFKVKRGGRFRFRVTNSAANFPFRVSVDDHQLNIIASDGSDVATTKAESVIVGSGERFDFWIDTDDPSGNGNYWIRVENLDYRDGNTGERVQPTHVEAILRYQHAPSRDPVSSRSKCSFLKPCAVVNCPYKFYPRSEHIKCVYVTDLRKPVPSKKLVPNEENGLMDKILSFQMGKDGFVATINGRAYVPYGIPPQIYPKSQRITSCNETICGKIGCECTHELSFKSNEIIQLTFFSPQPKFPPALSAHPIHTHGYKFQVLKIGWPVYDAQTGQFKENNPDIDCSQSPGGWCFSPRWADPSWENGEVPGLTTEGAIEKDTVMLPAGGYVVVRFKADNPGYWMLHCHMEPHSSVGMLMVMKEGSAEEMLPVPPGFPQCEDYATTDEEYLQQSVTSSKTSKEKEKVVQITSEVHQETMDNFKRTTEGNGYMVLSAFLALMLVVMTIALVAVLYRNKYSQKTQCLPRGTPLERNYERTPLL